MPRRKILHVIPSVGPQRGGPSVLVRTLACGLTAAGIETDVATTNDNGTEKLSVPLGVPRCENGVSYRYFSRQARAYTFSWPLSQWLAQHVKEYDLIHIHALFSHATISAASSAVRCGVPYIVRPLGTLNRWGMQHRRPVLKSLSFRLFESRILRHSACIHYTSEQERREAAELGVTSRSTIIPNPLGNQVSCVAGQFRSRHPELRNRKLLLYLSRLDAKKGLDLLLPAFHRVRSVDPSAALVLAGSGAPKFEAQLRKQILQLGLTSDVLWAGLLSGEEKQAALADADIFVLSSYSENFGIAPVEAMAAGLPVVVSNQVAIHEEIARAGAGLVVPCEVEPLTAALLRLLADAPLRTVMGRKGKCLTKQRYSLQAVTQKLVSLYEECYK